MKKIEKKTFSFLLIIIVIVILFGFTLYKYIQENNTLKNALPYLLKGEKIEYFDLVDMEAKEIDRSLLENHRLALIFIFSRPCSPCDKNVIFWKRMALILKDRVSIYGIVVSDLTEAINFAEKARLNFKIYVPKELNKFIQKTRLRLNFSQTIVYSDKVEYLQMGELNGKDAVHIIELTKGLK